MVASALEIPCEWLDIMYSTLLAQYASVAGGGTLWKSNATSGDIQALLVKRYDYYLEAAKNVVLAVQGLLAPPLPKCHGVVEQVLKPHDHVNRDAQNATRRLRIMQ